MHRATCTKFELLPEDMPPANVTDKVPSRSPLFADVSDLSSTLTEDDVLFLMRKNNIPSADYEFLVPSEDERANRPPEEYISVYKKQIAWGLRFPMHELVVEICNRMKVSPSQLRWEVHCTLVGFILCAKFYNIPITADCFFSLFTISSRDSGELLLLHPANTFNFLERKFSSCNHWKRKFFFLRPVGRSWNCLTKWSKTFSWPKIDASLKAHIRELARESGMLDNRIRVNELIEKDILVHGGIEPGDPSPQFTFRYLMHRAAVIKFELLPEDIPPVNATNKAPKKRLLSADANNSKTSRDKCAAPTSRVTIYDVSSSSEDTVPLEELFHKGEVDSVAAHKKKNPAVLISDEASQLQALPASLLAIAMALESMFVPRECYEKLEKEKQEITSELKVRVQELEQEIELYKSKKVDSDYRTSQTNVKVKILEKRLEKVKSNSDCLRDKIKNDVIEEFKCSDEFASALQEEAVKYYVDGFEGCKLQVLNSGKLPCGFNINFLDAAAAAECGESPGAVDNAADLGKKSLKRKKA